MLRVWQKSGLFPAQRLGLFVALSLMVITAGCGSVAVSVEKPVGTQVQLYEKGKWFGFAGPDWGTGWDKTSAGIVEMNEPAQLELDAASNWFTRTMTIWPTQYRAAFDMSQMTVYPNTPTSCIEVKYVRDVIPTEHQDVIKYWHQGRTLDALTNLPVDVLADVLYNLGDKFKSLLDEEVSPAVQERAARDFRAMLESPKQPSPKQVEAWLKSLLTAEQLGELTDWVEEGVTLRDVKWVRLGGEPRQKDLPVFWRGLKGFVELFIRQPEIRSTRVDFLNDVIIRDLLTSQVETKLVNLSAMQFYIEAKTFKTTYYSDRVVPALDIVEEVALAEVIRPTPAEEAELQQFGMTRSVRFDRDARSAAIRSGLPPVSLERTLVTSVRSQVLGALLENEMAYVVVWNNPREADPVKFITTVITTGPYGMARISALRGDEKLCEAYAPFNRSSAPIGTLASWVVDVLDQRSLFVDLKEPVAVFAFGNRRIAPFDALPRNHVSQVAPMLELEPAAGR